MLRLIALTLLLLAPGLVAALPVEVPSGVGPLPDLKGSAKTGALVTKEHIDQYRALLPPEVAELVERDEFSFEAVLRPRSAGLFGDAQIASSLSYALDDRGDISPNPAAVTAPFFGVSQSEGEVYEAKSVGWRILWNTTSNLWKLRSFSAALSLEIFHVGEQNQKRAEFLISRIYPAALGRSPGTLKPIFREKISALNPEPLLGLTWLTLRFFGAGNDYMWGASPVTGDVRQMTGSNRSDLIFSGAFSPDDLFVWSGKVESVEPTSVKLIKVLVPVVEGSGALQPTSQESCTAAELAKSAPLILNATSQRFAERPAWVPTNVRMALRNVWRIETKSLDPFSLDARQSVYIDADTNLPVYRVVWDQDGRMRRLIVGIIGTITTKLGSEPGWRGQVMIAPGNGERSVLTMNRLETCAQLVAGRDIIDFDPSRIGPKPKSVKQPAKAQPQAPLEAEPVDE